MAVTRRWRTAAALEVIRVANEIEKEEEDEEVIMTAVEEEDAEVTGKSEKRNLRTRTWIRKSLRNLRRNIRTVYDLLMDENNQ